MCCRSAWTADVIDCVMSDFQYSIWDNKYAIQLNYLPSVL